MSDFKVGQRVRFIGFNKDVPQGYVGDIVGLEGPAPASPPTSKDRFIIVSGTGEDAWDTSWWELVNDPIDVLIEVVG